ncbi:MAG: transporter substrate-binding domain-containing protein [Cyanobacteria bacterium P01_D01_bin.156]
MLKKLLRTQHPAFRKLLVAGICFVFTVSVVACSSGSITSQEVSGDVADASAVSATASGSTLDAVLSEGVIQIAVPQDSPPFGSVGTDGQPQGYDVDVAKMIAESMEVELELVPVTSTNRIPYLETGRADLVISSMGATPERAKSIYFSSTPYAPFFSGIYGSSSLDVSDYSDLGDYTVGVTQGALEDLELTEKAPEGTEIRRFEDNSITISALLAGQVDLAATGNTIAGKVIKDNPDKDIENKFVMKNSPCYIGMRRGDQDMLEWVNVFIRNKRLSGDLDKLSLQWFGEPLNIPTF